METQRYEAEWCLLQNQFESYEKHSLYIKLSSILGLFLALSFSVAAIPTCFILGVLWIQDAILKTFQSRIEPRLLRIEKSIQEKAQSCPFQFNTDYLLAETKGLSKIQEYAKQAVRPTVAFPHVVLIAIMLATAIFS